MYGLFFCLFIFNGAKSRIGRLSFLYNTIITEVLPYQRHLRGCNNTIMSHTEKSTGAREESH